MSDVACAPPVPNADISGIGVRVSFYLQYIFAGMGEIPSVERPYPQVLIVFTY